MHGHKVIIECFERKMFLVDGTCYLELRLPVIGMMNWVIAGSLLAPRLPLPLSSA